MRTRNVLLLAGLGTAVVIALPFAIHALVVKPLDVGAREQFSQQFSCPGDRIQVRARPDVKPFDVYFGERSRPPDEVARDPARLAIWEKGERERAESWNDEYEVFEVRGCGHEVIFDCAHAGGPGGETYPGVVSCIAGSHPPETEKPW